jgi:hypothetical protein
MRAVHDAYISWDEHLRLLEAIARNNQAKTYGDGQALLSGLGLLRCGICSAPMVVQYNNPERRGSGGRVYRNTPFTYICSRPTDRRLKACQNPAGPYVDRLAAELVVFALGELNLDGIRVALNDRTRKVQEVERLRVQRVEALSRRAQMLEDAIAEATRPEARTRLVARFEAVLGDLDAAREEAARPVRMDAPAIAPEVLARLEVLRDPVAAWARFALRTRKEILQALAERVVIYPDLDGYFVVMDWQGGGRAAGKVKTIRRRKVYPVPEEVLALFSEEAPATRRMAARP